MTVQYSPGFIDGDSSNPRSFGQFIYQYIRRNLESEYANTVENKKNREIRCRIGGYMYEEDYKEIVSDLIELEGVEKIAFLCANDTDGSGFGLVYNSKGEKIERYDGYERARGVDVEEKIRKNYGIHVSSARVY